MRLNLIVAVARNGVIGSGNALPWKLAEDTAYFKRTTLGHTVIMGRKTFESIGKPLPRRRNIVVTRQTDWHAAGTESAPSLKVACERAADDGEAFVIGGSELYREALDLAERLFVTEIHRDFAGDTVFPEIPGAFRETSRTMGQDALDSSLRYDFVVYER